MMLHCWAWCAPLWCMPIQGKRLGERDAVRECFMAIPGFGIFTSRAQLSVTQ
jgi:hypothetical protein